jgi:hypothetical protein
MGDEAHGLRKIQSLNNLHHETNNHLSIYARGDAFAIRYVAGLLGYGTGKRRRYQCGRIYYQDKLQLISGLVYLSLGVGCRRGSIRSSTNSIAQ